MARPLRKAGYTNFSDTTILNRVNTYEVDRIHVVLPADIDELAIDPQRNYVTIITCTPYGVNSHRLLVRAHKVDEGMRAAVPADALLIPISQVVLVLFVPALAFFLLGARVMLVRQARDKGIRAATLAEVRARMSRREAECQPYAQRHNSSQKKEL